MFYAIVNANSILQHVIDMKNGTIINIHLSIKSKKNIVCAKKIIVES